MKWNINKLIDLFSSNKMPQLLKKGLFGLEKEMLRTDPEGNLAMTPHPKGLGDKIKNPEITTDFSESQIELITSPFPSIEEVHKDLKRLQKFTVSQLKDEYLWPFSMPCRLPDDPEDIPIARYDDSPEGRKSEIYRRGLALRYGKYMQTISGVHFNRSFSSDFWKQFHSLLDPDSNLQTFINESYLHLVRNFIRYRWLLVLFGGASPYKDASYRCRNMKTQQKNPLSLRLSRCGYSNPSNIHMTYNHFEEHLNDLKTAVNTPYEPYAKLGLMKSGQQVQLNDHLLQIPNEYYFPIRLKPAKPHDDLLDALETGGVEYIEVRIFDLNPFEPTGVNIDHLYFADLFLIFCLLKESPPINKRDLDEGGDHQQEVAFQGQNLSILLEKEGSSISLKAWAVELLKAMKPLAELMDQDRQNQPYLKAWDHAKKALEYPKCLPAFGMIQEMAESGQDFIEYGLSKAKKYHEFFTRAS